MNQLSSFIDATTVYSANEKHMNLLRDPNDRMKLRVFKKASTNKPNLVEDLPPTVSEFEKPNSIVENFEKSVKRVGDEMVPDVEMNERSFVAGDTRAGEFPGKFLI